MGTSLLGESEKPAPLSQAREGRRNQNAPKSPRPQVLPCLQFPALGRALSTSGHFKAQGSHPARSLIRPEVIDLSEVLSGGSSLVLHASTFPSKIHSTHSTFSTCMQGAGFHQDAEDRETTTANSICPHGVSRLA